MRRLLILLLSAVLCLAGASWPLHAQGPPNPPPPVQNEQEEGPLQYPNNPVSDILTLYEKMTGKVLIRDASLAASPNLSIIVTKKIPKSEAIHLIEASLLLNGYSLVPDSENRVKVLYTAPTAKNPRSEGVPLYDNPTAIPADNQVVSYFMQLRFMASSDALAIFQQHVVLHSYGQIIEVPNAQAVVITENASLIRELIDLQELVDVPPARVISEFITLKRADAERVAETINKLIDAEKSDKEKHGAANLAANPAQQAGGAGGTLYENDLVSGSVQLIPDARTNRILVITRPANFPYIQNLIEEFDEEIGSSAPMERPLKYISAAEVLPTLADLLQENEGGGQGQAGGAGTQPGGTFNQQQAGSYQGLNSQNSTGTPTTGAGGGQQLADILHEPEDTGPKSVLVGKTHLIADNKANSIIVIGPPESQAKVRAILDELDKRPPQVYLCTVIGQLQLTKDDETGVDYLKLFSSAATSPTQNGFAGSVLNTTTSLVTPQMLTSAAAFPATGGLSLYGTIGKNLSVYIHALESTGKFKVLSRPVVYTANNKRAMISSGERVPYPSSTLSSVITTGTNNTALQANIDYEDVVLKLEVIPLINADNEVNLEIAQVNDSIAGSQTIAGNTVPTIATQQITTTVTVPDGNTVVLGGLITDTTQTNLTGIPILMDIPWLGRIFRDTKKSKERDELIIFIQPNVVHTDTQMVAASDNEKSHAVIGADAKEFADPLPLPAREVDSFFPKDVGDKGK